MIFRPVSADFDFWKFWPTNENFEIFEISTFSESGSKSRMRTSDSALESLNIIFFDLQILGTTWVPSGWPTCTWNKPKTSIFGKPTNEFFRSQNYLTVPKNVEIFMIKKYDVSVFQNRVDCFHTTSRYLSKLYAKYANPGKRVNTFDFCKFVKNDLEIVWKQSTRFWKAETSYFLIIEISKFLGTMR